MWRSTFCKTILLLISLSVIAIACGSSDSDTPVTKDPETEISTNNIIVTNTPVDDPDIKTTVITNFEDTPDLYHQIELLEDENDRIPGLPSYLQKALVYYVKAKIAEDTMNLEAKEYFMKEFRKMVEKYNNTRVAGLRIQAAGPFSIR